MSQRIALISFGCAKNLVDSEVMLGFLRQAGYCFAASPEKADIIVLNTCGFIRPAREEAEAAIRKALRLKRRDRGKRVVVAGCYVQRNRDALARAFPEVDDWINVGAFDKIVERIEARPSARRRGAFLYSHRSPRVVSTPPGWAYVKVSEGCSHKCAFCSIPLIKGPYRSRPVSSIVEEVEELAGRGVKEINLISQDTTTYGRDLGLKQGLVRLLRRLLDVRGVAWLRLLYGYPEEVSGALLEVMREPKICPYLDVPFQHADPGILKAMGRTMDADRGLRLIDKTRRLLPDVALRTSLIVGFPGEGRGEFGKLERFVREAAFDHLGVFTYSHEPGTAAFSRGNPVPESVKERRRTVLMTLQADISRHRNRRYIGRRLDVLLDRTAPGDPRLALGRTRFQAPEVDGLVRVRSPRPAGVLLQAIHRVEITSSGVYDLRGNLVG
jgi:ribosomal protein S12 methylthiotransferase